MNYNFLFYWPILEKSNQSFVPKDDLEFATTKKKYDLGYIKISYYEFFFKYERNEISQVTKKDIVNNFTIHQELFEIIYERETVV